MLIGVPLIGLSIISGLNAGALHSTKQPNEMLTEGRISHVRNNVHLIRVMFNSLAMNYKC